MRLIKEPFAILHSVTYLAEDVDTEFHQLIHY